MCLVLTRHAGIDGHVGWPWASKHELARSALSRPLSSSSPTLDAAAASIVAAATSIAVAATASCPSVPPHPWSPLRLGVLHRRLRSHIWRPQADLAKVWRPKNRDGITMAIPMVIRPHPSPIVKDHWSIPQQCYANAVEKLLGSYLEVI